ncbi:GNAT family N-acetyltransferase [Candidatus Babeliales bacterium]|nr:GNAT family N-acetyltransferase [Candidatus Babeliales bacterium]
MNEKFLSVRLFFTKYLHALIVVGVVIAGIAGYATYTHIKKSPPATAFQLLTEIPEELKGSLVTIKKLKEEHFLDYHNMFSNIVRENMEFPKNITLSYTIMYLKSELKKMNANKMIIYVVYDNADNKLIGSVAIREKNESDPGQCSCWINENYWGGGRIQEALRLIAKAWFMVKPYDSFYAQVRLWNKRSYHALLKAGFVDTNDYFYETNGEKGRHILEMHRKTVAE